MSTASVGRVDRLLPIVLAALVLGVAVWAANPYPVGVFHDDGVYVILGKSLATGQGYRFLHLPGAPAATHYPPLYPLFLALLWKAAPSFPGNVQTFLFANALLLGVVALGVDAFAQRVLGWPRVESAVAALIATLSTPLIMLSSLVLSEPMFAALLFPTLIAAERCSKEDASIKSVVITSIALGVLGLVRTHALALTIAFIGVLALRTRWKPALVAASVVCATIAPWELWLAANAGVAHGTLAGSYGTYSSWLATGAISGGVAFVTRTMATNAKEVMALVADHFSLTDDSFARNCMASLVIVMAIVGGWRAWRRAPVLVLFAVVYSLVLLAWPFTPWRFVYAVWPVLILFIGQAAMLVAERPARFGNLQRIACAAAVSVIAIGALRQESRAYAQRSWRQPGVTAAAQIAPLVRWVVAETKENDVVAVDGEQLVYLFTGRHALPVAPFTAAEYVHPRTASENAESLRDLIREYPVRYVATISPGNRASVDLLSRDSMPTRGPNGAVKLVPLGALAAGEAFRVEPSAR